MEESTKTKVSTVAASVCGALDDSPNSACIKARVGIPED